MDNNTIITGGLDKQVKVWNLKDKTTITLLTSEKPQLGDTLTAIATNDKYVIALTLDGKLHFWNQNEISDKKLASKVIEGHQNYISSVIYNSKMQTVYSADTSGKISNNNL